VPNHPALENVLTNLANNVADNVKFAVVHASKAA
jgi:hypothetical protein